MPDLWLSVRVTPRASRNGVKRYAVGVLHLRLRAPPVDGAANAACCAYVAELLRVRSSQIAICHGQESREKVLLISGLSEETMEARLQEASAES